MPLFAPLETALKDLAKEFDSAAKKLELARKIIKAFIGIIIGLQVLLDSIEKLSPALRKLVTQTDKLKKALRHPYVAWLSPFVLVVNKVAAKGLKTIEDKLPQIQTKLKAIKEELEKAEKDLKDLKIPFEKLHELINPTSDLLALLAKQETWIYDRSVPAVENEFKKAVNQFTVITNPGYQRRYHRIDQPNETETRRSV